MFRTVKPARLYEDIVEQISTLISEGKLEVGGKLPSERDLAQLFKVSRSTVREAIRALEHQGMLKSRPGVGTLISTDGLDPMVETFASGIARERKYIRDIMEVRYLLEPQIAYVAAQRGTDDNILEMEAILQRQEAITVGYGITKLDREFHLEIARAAQNAVLHRVAIILADIFAKTRQKYLQSSDRTHYSLAAHREVFLAIKVHNPRRARKAMQLHLKETEKYIESSVKKEHGNL